MTLMDLSYWSGIIDTVSNIVRIADILPDLGVGPLQEATGGSRIDTAKAYANLKEAFGNIHELIRVIAYVSGVYFIMRGIMMYRAFGSSASMASSKGEVAGPMVFIVIGAVLCSMGSMQDIAMTSIFGNKEADKFTSLNLALINDSNQLKWEALADMLSGFVSLIGYVAFVRGWFILAKMGHSGSQPGSVGKGITHIVGGIFLLNIVGTVTMIATTFGF